MGQYVRFVRAQWLKNDSHFKKTGTMPNFAEALAVGNDPWANGCWKWSVLFGEYFNNPDRKVVTIYEYTERCNSGVRHMFSGQIIIFMHFSLTLWNHVGLHWR